MIDLEELLKGVAPLSSGNFVKQLKNRQEEGIEVAEESESILRRVAVAPPLCCFRISRPIRASGEFALT